MVEWMTVFSLILFGLALIVVEIFFVPGTTLVGLAGFVFAAIGVGLSFKYFGSDIGWATFGGTSVAAGVLLYYAFKGSVWSRFSLKSSIDSHVNEGELASVRVGDEGVTISALRPSGKAELEKKLYEVRTQGGYVEAGTRIHVVQIQSNQIVVEPIK